MRRADALLNSQGTLIPIPVTMGLELIFERRPSFAGPCPSKTESQMLLISLPAALGIQPTAKETLRRT